MSDSGDENYITFGTALEPLDEENLPRKKLITLADQYAYDTEGRRRFHGAFTGGFSAGYFNSVGSQDGWRPQQFKSSRSNKMQAITQKVEDFMDEEDTSEFGIAPKGIRATKDYADNQQRGTKRERVDWSNNGPIPGTPVLKELLRPIRETVGVKLLRKMGWKPGQGVGCRITMKQKAKMTQQNASQRSVNKSIESGSENSDDESTDITFAPDDYEPFRCNPKDNYFGIGYSGLDRRCVLSGQINSLDVQALNIQDKNKKLSIYGQAFGVGAFEADDDDIYEKEDLSRYDFTLEPTCERKSRWSQNDAANKSEEMCLEGFLLAKETLQQKVIAPPPNLPKDFVPVHTLRKSRFYPPIERVNNTLGKNRGKSLNAADRARIIDDTNYSNDLFQVQACIKQKILPETNISLRNVADVTSNTFNEQLMQPKENSQKFAGQQKSVTASWMEKLQVHNFVKGGIVGLSTTSNNLKELNDFKKCNTDLSIEQQFSKTEVTFSSPDVEKNTSINDNLDFTKASEKQDLTITQLHVHHSISEHEYIKIDENKSKSETSIDKTSKEIHSIEHTKHFEYSNVNSVDNEVQQAAKMKLFGKLTRKREEWNPASIVCKRFNIPEPRVACSMVSIKKPVKFSILDPNEYTSPQFLKSTNVSAEKLEERSYSVPEKEKTINDLPSTSVSKDTISYDNYEPADNVSEKLRNFEASYEKVFGKDIQGTTNVSDDLLNKRKVQAQDLLDSEKQTNINSASTICKNKSEEKKDLFKAIFLSSSDESESEAEENIDNEATMKSILIGKIPEEINVQKNSSPPRGIFAKLDLDNLVTKLDDEKLIASGSNCTDKKTDDLIIDQSAQTSKKKQEHKSEITAEILLPPDMYGPKLPERLLKNEKSVDTSAESQLLKPTFKSVVVPKVKNSEKIHGHWVEQTKVKKSKKEKKKHKEQKSSKHKKKSKKRKH